MHLVEDASLGESEARLEDAGGAILALVMASLGSPQRPLSATALAAKVRALAGARLDGALDDDGRPAARLLAAVG